MGFRSSLKNQKKATRIFTDREEPRAAFWKKYNQTVRDMRSDTEDPAVLTYYGVGGIGKTSLLKQLIKEMEQKPRPPKYIYFDFTNVQDCYSVMKSLRNKLVNEHGFNFRLFDAGCYIYANTIGQKEDAPEAKQLTEKYTSLKVAMAVLGEIPGLSMVTKILSYADKAGAMIQTHMLNNQSEMEGHESANPAEMLQQLRLLFSMDMNRQMQNAEEPLVILLDTYEKLVNESAAIGTPLCNDLWLRSTSLHPNCQTGDGDGEYFCDGIIPNVPHSLWVIAGREKLKWENDNPVWAQVMEQHILGDLSESDSVGFLKGAGVEPELLRKQLYDLTNGTPIYLDLCVTHYGTCREQGVTPTIADFGATPNELIERFSRYMDDSLKSMVYLLSCLQKWDDSLLWDLAPQALPHFNMITYDKKVKHLSFVIQSDDGYYNIHQTVGEVLLQDCPRILLQKLTRAMFDYFEAQLAALPAGSEKHFQALGYLLRAGMLLHTDRNDLHRFFVDKLRPHISKLEEQLCLTQAELLLDKLEEEASKNRLDVLYALSLTERAWLLYKQKRNSQTAFSLAAQSVLLYTCLLGPNHLDTLQAQQVLSAVLFLENMKYAAYEIDIEVYAQYTTLLGEHDRKTLTAARNLLLILLSQRNYEYALPRAQEILEARQKHLPPDDRSIPQSMSDLARVYEAIDHTDEALTLFRDSLNLLVKYQGEQSVDVAFARKRLANALSNAGRRVEATPLYQQVLNFYLDRLGEMHPDTVDAMNALATVLDAQGLHDRALPLRQQVLELEKRLPNPSGTPGRYVASATYALIKTLVALGQDEAADKLRTQEGPMPRRRRPFQVALAGSSAALKAKQAQPATQTVRYKFSVEADPYPGSWSIESALSHSATWLHNTRKDFGEDNPATISTVYEFVLLLRNNHFHSMAEDFARDLVQRHPFPDNSIDTFMLPEKITALRDYYYAENKVEGQQKLVEHFTGIYGTASNQTCTEACILSRLLQEQGRDKDAIAVLEEHLLLWRQEGAYLQMGILDVYKQLIIAYQDAEQFDKSVPLKEELLEFYKWTFGNDHNKTMSIMSELIEDYRDFGQPEKSKQLKEALDAMDPDVLFPETPRRCVEIELPDEPAIPVPSRSVLPVIPPKSKTD